MRNRKDQKKKTAAPVEKGCGWERRGAAGGVQLSGRESSNTQPACRAGQENVKTVSEGLLLAYQSFALRLTDGTLLPEPGKLPLSRDFAERFEHAFFREGLVRVGVYREHLALAGLDDSPGLDEPFDLRRAGLLELAELPEKLVQHRRALLDREGQGPCRYERPDDGLDG